MYNNDDPFEALASIVITTIAMVQILMVFFKAVGEWDVPWTVALSPVTIVTACMALFTLLAVLVMVITTIISFIKERI